MTLKAHEAKLAAMMGHQIGTEYKVLMDEFGAISSDLRPAAILTYIIVWRLVARDLGADFDSLLRSSDSYVNTMTREFLTGKVKP